jgi:hypothetical protein
MAPATQAWNWHGSLRNKVQVDNRYTHYAKFFDELWGQFYVDDQESDFHAVMDGVARTTEFDGGNYAKLYQGFVEKGISSVYTRVKLGRFERTDNLGFYLVDGGLTTYAPTGAGWAVETYAGRPSRIDHLRSVDGIFVGGFDGRMHFDPKWGDGADPLTLDSLDIRGGYQHFQNDADSAASVQQATVDALGFDSAALLAAAGFPNALPAPAATRPAGGPEHGTDRLGFGATAAGRLGAPEKSGYEFNALATYRFDTQRFENSLVSSQLDLTPKVRLRASYEYFKPLEPYLTFREKFYSAYALGQQTLFRGRINHTPMEGLAWYVGGMRATREGNDGYGADLGGSYAFTPDLTALAEFDYLALGPENATSGYASLIATPNSTLQVRVNTALRYEEKLTYGDNRAVGAEGELRYMIRSDLVLSAAASYVWYTAIRDEYLGAVQFIYYFDNFKPKAL